MYKVNSQDVIFNFKPNMEAVLKVPSASLVHFDSNDCFFQQVTSNDDVLSEVDQNRLNPATGPVYVEGAEPGDLLQVDILAIDVAESGCAAVVPGHGALKDEAEEAIVRVIPIRNGAAHYLGLKLPIQPMIGVIGVAPKAEDGEWPTATPWKHGGNMDTRDIRKGTTLYLPVAQPGALFALGDVHALMADGEVCFTGLEIPADVLVRLTVLKGVKSEWPILETETETMVIASGEDLEEATASASSAMVGAMARALDVQWEEAYILASLVMDTRISQVVDPTMTVRAVLKKDVITTERILANL
ncbi:MAG: acetamidase/formamidase family protein [Eubacteriales bacterium]|nr:acetamidase/formamidase family protein [Eubacteriales bacterium]